MARLTITVRGLEEFQLFARKLPGVAAPEILRPIILRGAELFRASIEKRASQSSDTGATAETVVAKLVQNSSIAGGYASIDFARTRELRDQRRKARGQKPVANKARYPFIVATGAGPHAIKARDGGNLLIGGGFGGKTTIIKSVQHPGFTGSNFFALGVRDVRSGVQFLLEREIKAEYLELARRFGVQAS